MWRASAAVGGSNGPPRRTWTTKEDNVQARLLYDRIARFDGFIGCNYALA